jgi:hypothetical protein
LGVEIRATYSESLRESFKAVDEVVQTLPQKAVNMLSITAFLQPPVYGLWSTTGHM